MTTIELGSNFVRLALGLCFIGIIAEFVAGYLYFGPTAPAGKEKQWINAIPGKGWFVYFRIYGPTEPAFNGSWKPGDFEEVK